MQWARQEYMGIYGALQISARKAPQRQGVENLLSTDVWGRGEASKFPAVLTLVARQGQAPRPKGVSISTVNCICSPLIMVGSGL